MALSNLLSSSNTLRLSRGCRLAVLLLIGLGASQVHAAPATPSQSSGTEIKPAAIYHNYCSVCHGDKGDGRSRAQGSLNPPPKDFTNAVVSRYLTRPGMIDAVANGRPGTAMIGWKSQLNSKEIEAVVDYVRNTFMPAPIANDNNRGRVVYNKNCSVCHGDKGDGRSRAQGSLNPPPRDFTSAAARVELNRERLIKSITYGRAETAMAGFKSQLSAQDIEAVADYIRTGIMASASHEGISGTSSGARAGRDPHGMNQTTAAASRPLPPAQKLAAPDMAAVMPNGLKGDAIKGAAFYMSNCATCHGTTGDGRGPRAYFINPKPRNFQHTASRHELNRVAIYNATSEGKYGTEMPAWNKVMSPQEIANVSEFVFQNFIRTTGNAKQSQSR